MSSAGCAIASCQSRDAQWWVQLIGAGFARGSRIESVRDRARAMSDLIVTPFTPNVRTGRGVRTYGVTAALAVHGPVEVAYVVFDMPGASKEYAALERVQTRALHASRGLARAAQFVAARLRGVPVDLARGISPELAGAGNAAPPDARVIADGPTAAAALLPLARRREVVYLAHNLESGFSDRLPARNAGALGARVAEDVRRVLDGDPRRH